jgi:sarcosine oxidase, subunit beta
VTLSAPVPVDVVVIGGGAMGTSTAWHLAAAGVTDVVLLEAGELAGGSSGKPLGGVRAQFSDRTNVELGVASLEKFERFAADVGTGIGLHRVGYLFAIRDAADVAAFEASVAVQNELGVPSRMIDPAEAARLCRYLSADEVVAAAWSPSDGWARPGDVVRGYAADAARRGVTVRTGVGVTAIDAHGGRAVVTAGDGSRYVAPAVVCAAGAWSTQVGALAGVDLPIVALRRQIAFTAPVAPPATEVPFTIDYTTTAYFHGTEDGGVLLGWADPGQAPGFDRTVSDDWHEPLRSALRAFAPSLAGAELTGGWAGLYEMTPDCNAMIGEADAGFRFLYAAGFSGHGFLQSPAVGECVADLYLGRRPPIDVSPFDAARFRSGAERTEVAII